MHTTPRHHLAAALLAGALLAAAPGCFILTETFPGEEDSGASNSGNNTNNGRNNSGNNAANNADPNNANPNNQTNNGANNSANNSANNNGAPTWRYLLLEDLSVDPTLPAPGADIDAIGVRRDEAEVFAAEVVEAAPAGEDNAFNDPTQLLGAPDAECGDAGFVALGGVREAGYAIVTFADAEGVAFDLLPGDAIVVYELGPTLCPELEGGMDDAVLLSLSADGDVFTVIGEAVGGTPVVVP